MAVVPDSHRLPFSPVQSKDFHGHPVCICVFLQFLYLFIVYFIGAKRLLSGFRSCATGCVSYSPMSFLTVPAVRMVRCSPMPGAAVFFHQFALP